MANVVGPGKVAKNKDLYFTFTNTTRNTKVDINSVGGNYVIDVEGSIYELSEGKAVTLIGGKNDFANEKETRTGFLYVTQRQKQTVYKILKELALSSDTAQVMSDNEEFDMVVRNTYRNYCG
jgi:hypothetical protein